MSVKEIWRPVVGYESSHLVSNLGRLIRPLHKVTLKSKKGKKFTREIGEAIINGRMRGGGSKYYSATMETKPNGVRREVSIHRMVAMAFIPNPENKPEVNHKKGIKSDNRASQLEWVTKAENKAHAVKNGFLKKKKK